MANVNEHFLHRAVLISIFNYRGVILAGQKLAADKHKAADQLGTAERGEENDDNRE